MKTSSLKSLYIYYMSKLMITTLLVAALILQNCSTDSTSVQQDIETRGPYITVLGIAQDAGYPQAGCQKDCCKKVHQGKIPGASVVSLGLVSSKKLYWLFDATPDVRFQLQMIGNQIGKPGAMPEGIFLTHAHIGHYTGLIHFGREVMGTDNQPVYVLPRMDTFLRDNGPWSQLVTLENIRLEPIQFESEIALIDQLTVRAIQVPHRDEYSETAGYVISSGARSLLFIPDIDKWELWDQDILEWIRKVDYALLDGSFYANGEIPGRDMSLIPHPFVEESLKKLEPLNSEERKKVFFIHFNHTNPLLDPSSEAHTFLRSQGFGIAKEGQILEL